MEIQESGPMRLIKNDNPTYYSFGNDLRAFYREGDGRLFRLKENDDITLPGLASIYADSYFHDLLIRQAMTELERYVEEHMEDRSYFRSREFWNLALAYAGRPIVPVLPFIRYNELEKVRVNYWMPRSTEEDEFRCYYDLEASRLMIHHSPDSPPYPLARHLYGASAMLQILAQRQHEAFGLPDPYGEFCALNNFMVGKRIVNLHFVDGKSVQCYPRKNLNAWEIFRIEYGKVVPFSFNYRYDIPLSLGLPLKLTHRKDEHLIDAAALAALDVELNEEEIAHIEAEKLRKKIAAMIPKGRRVSCTYIEMKVGWNVKADCYLKHGDVTEESLLEIDEVKAFIKENCTEREIIIQALVTMVGKGEDGTMPDDLFDAIQKHYPGTRASVLPGYCPNYLTVTLDKEELMERYYHDDTILPEQRREFLMRKLQAAIPEYHSQVFYVVKVVLDHGTKNMLYRNHLNDYDDVAECPLLGRIRFYNPDDVAFKVHVQKIILGDSLSESHITSSLMSLVKEFGIEDCLENGIAVDHIIPYKINAEDISLDEFMQRRLQRLNRLRKRAGKEALESNSLREWPRRYVEPQAPAPVVEDADASIPADHPGDLEKLVRELAEMERKHALLQAANAYYAENGTLFGFSGLSDQEIKQIYKRMDTFNIWDATPFPEKEISDSRARIRSHRERIETLRERLDDSISGWGFSGGTVVANRDIGRLQIFFHEEPDQAFLQQLTHRWEFQFSRAGGCAWQRTLDPAAVWAAEEAIQAYGEQQQKYA